MRYGLSLEERKRKLIEDCCGGDGGGDGYALSDDSMTMETEPQPAIEKDNKKSKLNKFIKSRKNIK